jgi:hypothetical protein
MMTELQDQTAKLLDAASQLHTDLVLGFAALGAVIIILAIACTIAICRSRKT